MAQPENLLGIIEVSKREIQIMLEAGFVYLEWNKPKLAEEIFLGLQSLLPKSDTPLIALGNLYSAQGRSSEAQKAYRTAIANKPDSAIAYSFLGEELLLAKQTNEALQVLQKAKELDSEEGPAYSHAESLRKAHELGVFDLQK